MSSRTSSQLTGMAEPVATPCPPGLTPQRRVGRKALSSAIIGRLISKVVGGKETLRRGRYYFNCHRCTHVRLLRLVAKGFTLKARVNSLDTLSHAGPHFDTVSLTFRRYNEAQLAQVQRAVFEAEA